MGHSPELIDVGAFIHLIHRGVARRDLFLDDHDRRLFLRHVIDACADLGWSLVAWALMNNHVHLLARRGVASTATFVHRWASISARDLNRRHGRSGHAFEGAYRRIPIKTDAQLRHCIRYIHLNPVVAGVVPDANALDCYPWTGHRGVVTDAVIPCHDAAFVRRLFAEDDAIAIRRYRAYVRAGLTDEQEVWGDRAR